MIKGAMRSPFAAAILALCTSGALAQGVPSFDVAPLCRAEGKAAPDFAASCMDDEKKAHADLVRLWTQFPAESRTNCMRLATGAAGVRSYIELLTCLQINKDVKSLPKQ